LTSTGNRNQGTWSQRDVGLERSDWLNLWRRDQYEEN